MPLSSSSESSRAVTAATTTAAVAALLLGAAACGSSAKSKAIPKPSLTSSAPSATPTPTPTPTPSPTPSHPAAPPSSIAPPTSQPPSALVTVPAVPVRTQPPVAPHGTGNFGDGVTVKITKIEGVKSAGSGPGEIAGAPSVAMTIALVNGTNQPIPLNTVAVTATYGSAQTPASPSSGSPSAPFGGSVAARQTATGTYVFTIPVDQRGNVTVSMSYTANQPTVLFHGSVA